MSIALGVCTFVIPFSICFHCSFSVRDEGLKLPPANMLVISLHTQLTGVKVNKGPDTSLTCISNPISNPQVMEPFVKLTLGDSFLHISKVTVITDAVTYLTLSFCHPVGLKHSFLQILRMLTAKCSQLRPSPGTACQVQGPHSFFL